MLSSFLPHVLLKLHDLDESLPLGYICDRPQYLKIWPELPISVLIPRDARDLLNAELVSEAHRHGLKLLPWPVNQQSDLLRLADWGVDGLISDDPKLLARIFRGDTGS